MLHLDVLENLRRSNPWWERAAWEQHDRQLSALAQAPFTYDPHPLDGITPGNVYTLLGPRRVGKTTAVKVHIRELLAQGYPARRVVYYSCDLLRTADELAALLIGLYDEAGPNGLLAGSSAPFSIFLDEVQFVSDWQQAIKHLHDTHRLGEDCVVLTGSSARDLRSGGELLPGRRGRAVDRDRRLLPMTFRDFVRAVEPGFLLPVGNFAPSEFLSANQTSSSVYQTLMRPRVGATLARLVELLEVYARVGGFPAAVADYVRTREVQPATYLELWDVVRGDLNRYHQVRDPAIPLKVLERLALNVASPASWQKIARAADVDVKTVQAYVDLFTDAHLLLVVYRWEGGTLARRADKKIYPIDPLIAALPSVASQRARFALDPPEAAESLLGVALFRATESEAFTPFGVQQGVLYYRTGGGKEVDFLVGADRAPFESRYSDSVDRRAAQVLEQAFGKGVLATRATLDLDGKTVLIPVALLLSLLAYR